MSNRTLLPAAVLLFAVSTAACSAGATPSVTPAASPGGTPGASPTVAPTPTPAIAGIAHPTGAKDIVLRFDSSGGFVPPEFLAARVPFFTLYGDGRIVFVRSSAPV